jgi:D-threo-aldose 1-dehydrogenase
MAMLAATNARSPKRMGVSEEEVAMTTSSRRDFLSMAAAGSALATSGVFSAGASAAPADVAQGGGGGGHYVPPVKFGLGGVPFGNEFEVVSDEDAYKTLEAAWNAGVRYYDVSPWYGLGLGERRYGNFLHNKNRDSYVLRARHVPRPC